MRASRVLIIVIILLTLAFPLGCAPKPPETFLNEYFQHLFVADDIAAARALIQLPGGISTEEYLKEGTFPAEEPWVAAAHAIFTSTGALDPSGRARLWRTWKRDDWVSWKREHTTRTTATVQVRIESALLTAGGVAEAKTLTLNYILIRLEDQTWRLSKVEAVGWKRGSEFTVPGHQTPSTDK